MLCNRTTFFCNNIKNIAHIFPLLVKSIYIPHSEHNISLALMLSMGHICASHLSTHVAVREASDGFHIFKILLIEDLRLSR